MNAKTSEMILQRANEILKKARIHVTLIDSLSERGNMNNASIICSFPCKKLIIPFPNKRRK